MNGSLLRRTATAMVGAVRPVSAVEAAALAVLLVGSQLAIVALFAGSTGSDLDDVRSVLLLMALLCLPMLALLWASRWIDRIAAPRPALAAMLAVGVLMRLAYAGAPPILENDHYRYLLDGAMLAHGLDPYVHAPATLLGPDAPPAAATIASGGFEGPARDAIGRINFADLRTIYPGTAQLAFALAHAIAPWSLDGLRLVMAAAEAATTILLLILLRRLGRSPLWAGLYWLCPLLAFNLTGQAHVDALASPFVLGALLLATSGRGAAAGVALGFGIGVKLWPVLLAPLLLAQLWGKTRPAIRFVLATAAVAAALCLPMVVEAFRPAAGLAAYAQSWSVNNAPYAWASWVAYLLLGEGMGERLLRLALAAVICLVALVPLRQRAAMPLARATAAALMVSAALFYLSPAQFPWYAAWFLPLAAVQGNRALLAAAATLPVYYLFFPLAAAGLRDWHGYGLAALHLLPIVAMLTLGRGTARTTS